jgi:pimeloyl-ACP methyl ester carboxylesterase
MVASVLRVAAAFLFACVLSQAATAEDTWMTLPVPGPMPAATSSGTAKVNGIDLYYATYGSGDPVILLHGGLGNADYWANQVPELAKSHQVIVADSRGHGRSTRNADPYSYHLMAEDIIGLMDHLKIGKAALVGWSDGGIIGLDIAMNHPDRLSKLFAFGANYNVGGLREDIGTSTVFNAYIEQAGKDYARLSKTPGEYDAFVAQISEMWATQPDYKKEQLQAITVPTVIADGQYDEGIKQEHTREMAQLIPGSTLLIMPNLSHFAMWQDPAAFNQALTGFLAK